jgi:hypothetical protein
MPVVTSLTMILPPRRLTRSTSLRTSETGANRTCPDELPGSKMNLRDVIRDIPKVIAVRNPPPADAG